jgi:hypothetical protein
MKKEIAWETTHRWDSNIKTDIKEIGRENVEWIHLAQDRIQCTVIRLREQLNALNFLTGWAIIGFSKCLFHEAHLLRYNSI